jgi:acetyl esterase/lipase
VRAEGGDVEHYPVPGMVHGFFPLGRFFHQAREAVRAAALALRRAV